MLAESGAPHRCVPEFVLDGFKFGMGWEEVETVDNVHDVLNRFLAVDENTLCMVHLSCKFVFEPELAGHVPVVVEVNNERAPVTVGEFARRVDGSSRLPETAFQDADADRPWFCFRHRCDGYGSYGN